MSGAVEGVLVHGVSMKMRIDDRLCDAGTVKLPEIVAHCPRVAVTLARFVNVLLPYHDPVRVAEELAVIDRISKGRVEALLLGGYVPAEMRMFGVDPRRRGELMEAGVAALKQAWTGQPFEFNGRPCRVQPTPVQQPHPPLLMGGSAHAAARRLRGALAARRLRRSTSASSPRLVRGCFSFTVKRRPRRLAAISFSTRSR